MPKLSDAELEEFFRWREQWKWQEDIVVPIEQIPQSPEELRKDVMLEGSQRKLRLQLVDDNITSSLSDECGNKLVFFLLDFRQRENSLWFKVSDDGGEVSLSLEQLEKMRARGADSLVVLAPHKTLHLRTRDVAKFHVLPKLGDGRKRNLILAGERRFEKLIREGKKKEEDRKAFMDEMREEATNAGAAFQGDVKKFLWDERLKYAQQGEEESDDEPSDPATHAKKGPRKRHLTHRDEVINTIVTAMFRPKSKFEYRSVPQSILYFACMAADENAVLALIEPPEKRVERKRGIKTDSLGEFEEQGHEVSDEASPQFPRPEKVVNTVDRQAQIQDVLKEKADKWLALALLFEVGEYSWREIASALQGKSPPEGWAQAGQRGSTQPRNPANVWDDIKSGFDLPDWNTVRGWFPPPTPNEEALRGFYCRGAQELRKKLADV